MYSWLDSVVAWRGRTEKDRRGGDGKGLQAWQQGTKKKAVHRTRTTRRSISGEGEAPCLPCRLLMGVLRKTTAS